MRINRRVVLAARPQGVADLSCFRLEEVPLETPRAGEVLLRTLWLSLDPYMRGRMSEAASYAAPVAIGGVMTAQAVCRVEQSSNENFREGDLVLAGSGWQEFALSDGSGLIKLPAQMERPSFALGVLGMPGLTAYVGLLDLGRPQPGETVALAAATGAVGSVVGQIAKLKGCRVVGIAGGPEKCAYAVEHLGFDSCLDHRAPGLGERLAAACPKGIDVYFENVGGPITRTLWPLLNVHARVPVCGLISQYEEASAAADSGSVQGLMRSLLVKRITLRGFIIFDHYHRREEFLASMQGWLRTGEVKYREDVVHGLENAPAAFLGLLAGRNFGKLVVDVGARA